VTFDPFSPTDHWDFPDQKSKRAIRAPISSRLSVNTAEAAIDAAAADPRVTRVLSYQVAEAARQGKIQIVLAHHEPPPVPVNLIHAGRALTPLKVRMLLDFAAPRLRARLA
jgi:DNA-binding transcriptional LysR family regulator